LKTKIPLRRALKKHVGYLHDEKEDPLTANGDDVKRQPAGPRAGPRPNVDRRSDASTLQMWTEDPTLRASSGAYAEEA
jgi:hypothetical protein